MTLVILESQETLEMKVDKVQEGLKVTSEGRSVMEVNYTVTLVCMSFKIVQTCTRLSRKWFIMQIRENNDII